jgi:hypothetical protein
LNLNIFAAVSGIFSGKGKKTTDTKADGSSHSVEHTRGAGKMHGSGAGTLNAIGKGESEYRERHRLTDEAVATDQKQQLQGIDHLGIEDSKK